MEEKEKHIREAGEEKQEAEDTKKADIPEGVLIDEEHPVGSNVNKVL